MTNDPRAIVDQAIDWHLRTATMAPEEWSAFIVWLEADPAHARAYDRIDTGAHVLAKDMVPVLPVAANDDAPPLLRRAWVRVVGGAALAAGLAALLAPAAITSRPDILQIETAAGETRDVVLADGTRIEVNGASRLVLDNSNLRLASLEFGEATFHVRHDRGSPFTVRSGGVTIQDVGTVFNVARDGRRLDVQVAEGAVLFQPGAAAVPLTAGSALTAIDGKHGVVFARVSVDNVGGWRSGRLSFTAEPVTRLADAIHRRYGTDIVMAPGVAKQTFTGVVTLSGDANRDMPHVAALIGVEWRQDGARWTLSPQARQPG